MKPVVSVITLTYCRVPLLEEAVECFRRQQLSEPAEMVIFNSFLPQKLKCGTPGVKVVNWHVRPNTVGEARNLAIEHASGEWLVTLDDDDLMRPHYLAGCLEAVRRNQYQWAHPGKIIWSQDRRLTNVAGIATNQLIFSREIWRRVKGYPAKNSGEDKEFVARLREAGPGGYVEMKPGYIYGWGGHSGLVCHLSGSGEDKPGRSNSLVRAKSHAMGLISRRTQRPGEIVLHPRWRKDYEQDAAVIAP